MDPDRYAETFSEALFSYLWYTENLISGTTAAETVGDMSEFVSDAAKAVVVLSALTVPSFNDSMEDYFKRHAMTRRSVFTFLTKYCFDNHAETDDIFAVVLNTCTFVYRLVIFCQHRGHVEYVQFAAMCWTEIFEMDLKDEFYARGGWDEFRKYVSENRYVPKDGDTDQRAVSAFLEEINYLFPKLNVEDPDPHPSYYMSPETMANLEASCMAGVPGSFLTSEMLANEFIQATNYLDSFGLHLASDDSADEANEVVDLNEEPTSDSDEDLFHELVRVGLNCINKFNAAPPSEDCAVCNGENELSTVSRKDKVCPKHDPDSFYYLVTNSETEEGDEN